MKRILLTMTILVLMIVSPLQLLSMVHAERDRLNRTMAYERRTLEDLKDELCKCNTRISSPVRIIKDQMGHVEVILMRINKEWHTIIAENYENGDREYNAMIHSKDWFIAHNRDNETHYKSMKTELEQYYGIALNCDKYELGKLSRDEQKSDVRITDVNIDNFTWFNVVDLAKRHNDVHKIVKRNYAKLLRFQIDHYQPMRIKKAEDAYQKAIDTL